MTMDQYVLKTVHNVGIILKSASGCRFKDHQGREYIDFACQGNTILTGYNNRAILEPIRERLKDWANATPYMLNQDQLEATALMAKILPGTLKYTSFYSNGSDAIETAIKLAFRATGRRKVISHWGGYHGFSAYAMAAGGALFYRQSFEPMIAGFIHIPPPYLTGQVQPEELINNVKDAFAYEGGNNIAAVLVEPIVSGGIVLPPPGYLQIIRQLCDEKKAILIFDEVITGFGKTGKMFAFEHFDVQPDILVMGKAITNSAIPGAAIAVNQKVMSMLGIGGDQPEDFIASDENAGQHVVTNQNHPLICVAAKANIEFILKNNLVERSKELGEYFLSQLCQLERSFLPLKRARGKGLQLGVEITQINDPWKGDGHLAAAICKKMFEKGVIHYSSDNRIRDVAMITFTPPLIVTREDIDEVLKRLEQSLGELLKK